MTALEYWVGALLLASVKRYEASCRVRWSYEKAWRFEAHSAFYNAKRGYRSLRFKLNSTAFHEPERLGLPPRDQLA